MTTGAGTTTHTKLNSEDQMEEMKTAAKEYAEQNHKRVVSIRSVNDALQDFPIEARTKYVNSTRTERAASRKKAKNRGCNLL